MCGRYTLTKSQKELQQFFGVDFPMGFSPRYNIGPMQTLPVLSLDDSGNKLMVSLMRWGLIPHWAEGVVGAGHINARSETVAEKPAFKDAFRHRRLLIPANGFFEWRQEGKEKEAYYINFPKNELFAFAGLWDVHQTPQGKRQETFTILTAQANPNLQDLHHRMPVIVEPDAYNAWLSGDADHASIFRAPLSAQLTFHRVGPAVNRVGFDAPECIAFYEKPQLSLGF
ncbi:MAG: SOS response-associated peptidase [Myxococcota bacterium]|jgi:putative SOS response-associated peptidase YedK|nr:SOS response-associated peptidase [Myxococcota bacterium]